MILACENNSSRGPVGAGFPALNTTSKRIDIMPAPLDTLSPFKGQSMVGQIFQRLTVTSYAGKRLLRQGYEKGAIYWNCQCSCGNTCTVAGSNLKLKKQVSCGCWKDENTVKRSSTHGHSRHPLYAVWCCMIQRCTNPSDKAYPNYGGRGIGICERWTTFEHFWDDMAATWKQGLWIERKNNDLGYSPENCVWETPLIQSKNKRNNTYVTFQGERKTVTEWAKKIRGNTGLVSYRMLHGWTPEQAVTTPPRGRKVTSL